MRFIAGSLIGIAGIWLGFALSGSLNRRAEALLTLKNAFEDIRRRIVYLGQPISRAFAESSPLLFDVSEAIMLGSEYPFSSSGISGYLYAADIAILNEQIRQMYLMDMESRKEVCDCALEKVGSMADRAKEEANKNGKILRTLCTCLGIAAAICVL